MLLSFGRPVDGVAPPTALVLVLVLVLVLTVFLSLELVDAADARVLRGCGHGFCSKVRRVWGFRFRRRITKGEPLALPLLPV